MKKFIFLILSAVLILVSCQESYMTMPDQQETTSLKISTRAAITPEQAVEKLKAFLSSEAEQGTRSSGELPQVAEIYPVVVGTNLTRGFDRESESYYNKDTLAYVANFLDESGYAFISSDENSEEEIIAVIEDGKMSEEIISRVMEDLTSRQCPVYKDYPINGPGLILQYGDTIINPNTFKLASSIEKDTLVGNYKYKPLAAYEKASVASINYEYIEEFVAHMCLKHALYNKYQLDKGLSELQPIDPGDPGFRGDSYYTKTSYTPWVITEQVKPLLTKFASWTQYSPFNDAIYKHRAAGCVPLAIAKIMTYNKTPANMTSGPYTIYWDALTNNLWSQAGRESAAYLIRNIVKKCDSMVLSGGTFTFPNKAIKYMKSHGFPNTKEHNYTYTLCKNQLKLNKVLMIYGVPRYWDITKSHCWNIDGYKIQSRNKEIKTYKNNELIDLKSETMTSEMVHCDMGWGGRGNGYYVSGVFKPYYSETELDNPNYDGSWYYTNYLHLITY